MSLLDKEEVQDICGHTALRARKWSGYKKIEQCHKLLLVLGGGLAPTRSYSERWQVDRIVLCGRGAVCGAFKI